MKDRDGPLIAKAIYGGPYQPYWPAEVIERWANARLHRNKVHAICKFELSLDKTGVTPIIRFFPEFPMEGSDELERTDKTSRKMGVREVDEPEALRTAKEAIDEVFKALATSRPNSPLVVSAPFLAKIVDAFARKLRQEGAPASRWATFVHVGV